MSPPPRRREPLRGHRRGGVGDAGPSTTHLHILATLLIALRGYVEREGLGVVLSDVDLLFVEELFRPM